ncbi:hypothetical protein H8356DRAFT_1702523 [Neocallimastix lanati (nom. inval.)]|nr:hypothetical protein H8356DRAFT_1702523 [Neocallimastix sp. JGI-2020a]
MSSTTSFSPVTGLTLVIYLMILLMNFFLPGISDGTSIISSLTSSDEFSSFIFPLCSSVITSCSTISLSDSLSLSTTEVLKIFLIILLVTYFFLPVFGSTTSSVV